MSDIDMQLKETQRLLQELKQKKEVQENMDAEILANDFIESMKNKGFSDKKVRLTIKILKDKITIKRKPK